MNVVSVVSAKGGVGKSTMSASLSAGLQSRGHRVLAVDLDPQNGLRHHFASYGPSDDGLVSNSLSGKSLSDGVRSTGFGVNFIPYGDVSETSRARFEYQLAQNPYWLRDSLDTLNLDPDTIVVIDTPPGPSVYMSQALRTASLVLAVILPDASSYATLPQIHALIQEYCVTRKGFLDYGFIVNQVDSTRQLSRDVLEVLRVTLEGRLIGTVHLDQSVSEALASGRSLLDYNPYSEAARDVYECVRWIESSFLIKESS